jgi:hypothetical protein
MKLVIKAGTIGMQVTLCKECGDSADAGPFSDDGAGRQHSAHVENA